jgi:hypothetical protein
MSGPSARPLWNQPNAVDPLAAFLDELAALVFVDRPGNAVRGTPVVDAPCVHGFLLL